MVAEPLVAETFVAEPLVAEHLVAEQQSLILLEVEHLVAEALVAEPMVVEFFGSLPAVSRIPSIISQPVSERGEMRGRPFVPWH